MGIEFDKKYNTIVSALSNKNLLAVTNEGQFKEVGFIGRIWRLLTGLITDKKTFTDCYAATVGNKIVEFVKTNKTSFTQTQKETLVNELKSLKDRLKNNQYNIQTNIDKIKDVLGLIIK